MRILHLSTSDYLGAYSAAYRVHKSVLDHGHDSLLWVAKKTRKDSTVIGPAFFLALLWAASRCVMAVARRLIFTAASRTKFAPSFNLSLLPVGHYLSRSKGFRPDLIIVYCINDFLSLRSIELLVKKWGCKVAFYHMDMSLMTGSCHYAWDCGQYTESDACGNCVMQTRTKNYKKLITRNWLSKSAAVNSMQPIVFCGSEQLLRQSTSSSLLKNFAHHTVLMAIEPLQFKPVSTEQISRFRSKIGLDVNSKVIFFGAQSLADPRKGFAFLERALLDLDEGDLAHVTAGVTVLLIGKGGEGVKKNPLLKYVCIDFISDPCAWASVYACVDVMVCASIEDSGPMMINEAIMSGLPVIAFNTGVAPNLIREETGWLINHKNASALKTAIKAFLATDDLSIAKMRSYCREFAINNCSPAAQIKKISETISLS